MTSDDNCTICLEKVSQSDTDTATRLSCMHLFHTDCIIRWQNRTPTCPICRQINKQSRSSNHLLNDGEEREATLPLSWPSYEVPLQPIFSHPPLHVASRPPQNCGYVVANHPQMSCLQPLGLPVLTGIAGLVWYLGDAVKKAAIGPGIPPATVVVALLVNILLLHHLH